jgi:hypothetical protein
VGSGVFDSVEESRMFILQRVEGNGCLRIDDYDEIFEDVN